MNKNDNAYVVAVCKIDDTVPNPWKYICSDGWTMTENEHSAKRVDLETAAKWSLALLEVPGYRVTYFLASEFNR